MSRVSVKTSRAEGTAEVTIDYKRCPDCRLCVEVCKGGPLYVENGKVQIDQSRFWGCVACGQCMAVCPRRCISVKGRCFSPEDAFDMPPRIKRATYEQLYTLMVSRRSVRNFTETEVEQDVIDRILEAAASAPVSIPPSDVRVAVFKGRDKVGEFAGDIVETMKVYRWVCSPLVTLIMRPFIKKETYQVLKTFVRPAVNFFTAGQEEGQDYLLYNAPLAMYFYGSLYSDPADPYIVATYAMLAAEALGLGACMIGSAAPFIRWNRKLCAKYGISPRSQNGIVVIFGYPKYRYHQALRRTLAEITYC